MPLFAEDEAAFSERCSYFCMLVVNETRPELFSVDCLVLGTFEVETGEVDLDLVAELGLADLVGAWLRLAEVAVVAEIAATGVNRSFISSWTGER
jgi:hypothetical protein